MLFGRAHVILLRVITKLYRHAILRVGRRRQTTYVTATGHKERERERERESERERERERERDASVSATVCGCCYAL
jgi:hypothetical protein